jgi:hypothetical protein
MSVLLVSPSNGSAKPTSGEMKDLKRQVDSAFTVLEEYGEKARLGRMSLEKAQELAKKEISELRYDNDDYFFIFDVNLKMVVHPFMPELVGKDMSSWKDPAGKYLFRDFRSVAIEKGEGFSTYYWPKPGLSYPVEKLVYSKLYRPWSWIIASGIYTKQTESIVAQEHFIVTVSLIELYKIQTNKYPDSLADLRRFGPWADSWASTVRYEKVPNGYNLFLVLLEIDKDSSVTLPSELKRSLGIVKTNVEFTADNPIKPSR